MSRDRTPYPVSLYDPPLGDATPEYGDEDAPAGDKGLPLAEYLRGVADGFRAMNTSTGDYLANLIAVKAQLCANHKANTPEELHRIDSEIFTRDWNRIQEIRRIACR